ncbi:MAG TPA: hypothetical protein PLS15_12920 [Fimbriimonadaceae bacterium]|nr:hypothetical protein [Fimbriimonadaceae bacterium]HRE92614.1 hypothetical protein [Fimbriimonadaceae bacterium]
MNSTSKAGTDNIRTLVMSGALNDLRLALNSSSDTERLELLARFERGTAMVTWSKLKAELREVIK